MTGIFHFSWKLIWHPLSLLWYDRFFFLSLHFANVQSASFIPRPYLRYLETFTSIPKLLLTKYSQTETHIFHLPGIKIFVVLSTPVVFSITFWYYILCLFFCDISIASYQWKMYNYCAKNKTASMSWKTMRLIQQGLT